MTRTALRRWRRRGLVLLIGGIVAFVLLSVVAALTKQETKPAAPVISRPDQERLVFTYFYYWYDLPGGPHSTALTDHPSDPNASYRRVPWMKQELQDMEAAGIDIALAVYWGDAEPSSDVGLANMVTAASQLRQERKNPPRIGLFLDTGLIGRWHYDERDLRKTESRERLYELIKRFYIAVPRDQWALVDGRPVFWLWGSWLDIRFNQAVFTDLNARFEADFGTKLYVVGDNSWRYEQKTNFFGRVVQDRSKPLSLDDFYSWGASLEGYREEGGNIAQIGPGYDERQLGGSPDRTGRYRDREGGDFYARSWEAAIASGKRLIAIETWNEFHEAAGVADSREYGRQYIELTRKYADRFKSAP